MASADNSVEIYELSEYIPVPSKKPSSNSKGKSFQVAMVLPFGNDVKARKFLNQEQDLKLASEIFILQKQGDFSKANAKLKKLKNNELRGHVLAQRFLSNEGYVSTAKELREWLKHFNDYPQANKIYKLALRKGAAEKNLTKPKKQSPIIGNYATAHYQGKTYQSHKKRTKAQTRQYFDLKHEVKMMVQIKEPTNALNLINKAENVAILDDVEYDRLRADVAAGYLYAGRLNHASRLAEASIKRSGDKAPQAGWVKGLVAWQEKKYKASFKAFEMAADSPYATGWMVSSSSYWASRAAMRSRNKKHVKRLVKQAAEYPHSFYGVIANYALGNKDPFYWETPRLNKKHLKLIQSTDAGKRAILLLAADQKDLAQQELMFVNIKGHSKLKMALIALAQEYGLADLSIRLGNAVRPEPGKLYDAALYPEPSWQPNSGYKVDRALINAIIRQESRFQVGAKNPSGATGLMQLMPRTADYILSKTSHRDSSAVNKLHHPEVNLEFGQTYLHYLLNHKAVGQDLFSMAIAYNAGPGNLSKWKTERSHIDDPLLFIETIPFHETRAFVDRVMANYWIYRIRYNQDTPSLEDVAEGRWARYIAQDRDVVDIAMR
ncbi:MAG: lytic transglycosylase domain-containing protein [Pseudomonadota bacterium]